MSADDLTRELDAARLLLPRLSTDRGQALAAADRLRTLPTIGPALGKVLEAARSMAGQGLLLSSADVAVHVGILPDGVAPADLLRPCGDLLGASEALRRFESTWRIRQEREAVAAAAAIASGKDGSPLANLLDETRRAMARSKGSGYKPAMDLAREWIEIDEMLASGEAGAELLTPFFSAFALEMLHGWMDGGRLTPGMRLLIGGGSNSGKTSLANAIAASLAMASIPVFCWQADMDRRKHALDMAKILLGLPRGTRGRRDMVLPPALGLVRYPADDVNLHDVGAIADEVTAWCDELELHALANPGKPNPLRGVLVVDYLQMVEDEGSSSSSDYRRSEAVASKLAAIAARTGVAMVWLSQVSRSSQKELGTSLDKATDPNQIAAVMRKYAEECYQGADLRRSADVAFALTDRIIDGERKRLIIAGKDRGCAFGAPFRTDRMVASIEYDHLHGGWVRMAPMDAGVLANGQPVDESAGAPHPPSPAVGVRRRGRPPKAGNAAPRNRVVDAVVDGHPARPAPAVAKPHEPEF